MGRVRRCEFRGLARSVSRGAAAVGARCRGAKKKLIARPERRFAHFVAKTLGRTVDELEIGMSGAEFGDWMALYSLEYDEREGQKEELEMDVTEFLQRTGT